MRDLHKDLVTFFENNDFWTVSRNKILLSFITKNPVLDAGGGVGAFTKDLVLNGFDVWMSDSERLSCQYVVKNKITPTERVFVWDLTKKLAGVGAPKFGTIVLADVIEHIKNESAVVANCHSILRKEGDLVISVPHDQRLWNINDVDRGHVKRYGKEEIKKLLEENGFIVRAIKFRNMLVVVGILFSKIFNFRIPHERVSRSPINSLLKWYLVNIEDRLPLPYGSEMIIVATKK